MTPQIEPTRKSAIKIIIVVVPALLIASICIALYLGANAEQEESDPIVGEVTVPEMADYLLKVHRMIGERDLQSDSGQKAFRQIAAMTMGTLGPENLGYEIFKAQSDAAEGLLWPTIWIKAGDRKSTTPVVVAIPQAESGTGLAFAYGFAEYLTSHESKSGVRIVIYPPLYGDDLAAWVWARCGEEGDTMAGFIKVTGGGEERGVAEVSAPAVNQSLLEELAGTKGWEGNVSLQKEVSDFLEIKLAERLRSTRMEHAQSLIRMMPLVKELVEGLEN